MIYKASWDWLVWVVTLFVFALGCWFFVQGTMLGGYIVLVVLAIGFLFAPRHYVLNEDALILQNMAGSKRIDLSTVKSVSHVESSKLRWSMRTFGVGGLFGYYGFFHKSGFGNMQWYCTQRKNFILIELNTGKRIVITPDDLSLMDKLKSSNRL